MKAITQSSQLHCRSPFRRKRRCRHCRRCRRCRSPTIAFVPAVAQVLVLVLVIVTGSMDIIANIVNVICSQPDFLIHVARQEDPSDAFQHRWSFRTRDNCHEPMSTVGCLRVARNRKIFRQSSTLTDERNTNATRTQCKTRQNKRTPNEHPGTSTQRNTTQRSKGAKEQSSAAQHSITENRHVDLCDRDKYNSSYDNSGFTVGYHLSHCLSLSLIHTSLPER